ncbi:MAG: response regulator [Marinobacter sp.]|nr:response regulator [Marinobacter sp.]
MTARQHIFRERRKYNQWVANQTLEDYALRFTAKRSRRWSAGRVANTALGAISFLALEAIGGAITLQYGFSNALAATLAVGLIIFLTAVPISIYAARYGVDIDLLTRGAGFGYIGSTITSLIYATFTFIFFALEAVIMAMALELLFGVPLAVGYVLCAVVIIPLVTHGITLISRFQLWTQPLFVVMQLFPFLFIIYLDASAVEDWTQFAGIEPVSEGVSLLLFGAAAGVMFALIAQIGEQVDFLRFIPEPQTRRQRWGWWAAVMAGGPGWIVVGVLKILAGSFLAVLALNSGVSAQEAADPTHMYMIAFGYVSSSPQVTLAVAGIFVILCQIKINVTNAYAGSIAWSNFFSRLTHSHPGRVVWLVFNVTIALLVMELGVYRALEETLGFYGVVAVAWVGSLVADLVINKPLGLSPKHIEFKRAHLYDINPVGVGAMLVATLIGVVSLTGMVGEIAKALAHFITLATALVVAPLIAWLTKGRYYLARQPGPVEVDGEGLGTCCICEHRFEKEDIADCPAYGGAICSLCCSLDARCGDYCKPGAGYVEQLRRFFTRLTPGIMAVRLDAKIGHFLALLIVINGLSGLLLSMIYFQTPLLDEASAQLLSGTLWKVFFILIIITGVVCWLFVLAHESRVVAQDESQRQTRLLMEEISAHERTDKALQHAKEHAEAANDAKSRYLTGISHELRSPLNAILGYAQLLEKDQRLSTEHQNALGVIRRSGDYLADLIEGLLDISKIEAGRLDLHQDQVRLDLLMDQLVHMFRLQAQEKGLAFDYRCSGRLPELVKTDEKRLRQILINLLSNAIKYTERGGVALHLRYRNQVAEFTVRDTGNGIALADQERIFQPFERLRASGSNVSGTGLGLTITRLLTDIMGGDIALDSTPGKGSVFRVSLMLSSVSAPSAEPVAPVRTPKGFGGPARRILVVDDDDSHRQLMRALLAPLGFSVTDINSALLAMEVVQREQPDLVLLDVSMPGMDGWTLLGNIRQHYPQLPVLMVSADASEGRGRAEGAPAHNGYLIKPVRLNNLLELLGQQLNLNWQFAEDSASTPDVIPALEIPPTALTRHLLGLAAIGHRKGLLEEIYKLRDQQVVSAAFIQTMINLTNDFQFEQIKTLLQSTEQSHEAV